MSPSYGCVGVVTGPTVFNNTYDASPGFVLNPTVGTPTVVIPPAPVEADPKDTKKKADDTPSSSTVVSKMTLASAVNDNPAPARLTIEVPENAKLFVDGQATRGDGTARPFHTPALPPGQAFYYEFRAEVEIDGKIEIEEKKVVVRAGDVLTESFPKLIAAATKSKPATVAAK